MSAAVVSPELPPTVPTTVPSTAPSTVPTSGPVTVITAFTTTDLVEAARRREPGAWDELVARYGGLVRRVAAGYRLQQADAADAVQNTWLRALERLHTLRDPERLGGWLATTADRECLALLRRTQREVPDERAGGERPAAVPGPEAVVVGEEARQAVGAAVAELTGRRQALVQALFYEPELSYVTVSEVVGIPVGSIGPTRGRALRNLRCTLERAGFGAEHEREAAARRLRRWSRDDAPLLG